jgi:hypothetical protein
MITCAPLTKSPNWPFPDHQRSRVGRRIAVLEAQHGLFGQHRVDDRERRLLGSHVLQRHVGFAGLLVVQHRVAMEERAAAAVLAP